jgi:hypothetical protein
MKSRETALFLAWVLLVSAIATAQNKPDAEKKDPLPLVKIAVNIAGNLKDHNLNGFLAVYIDSESWASGLKDSDLGPFLKLKETKPNRSAVLIFSPEKDTGICVFFDGDSAFGATGARAKDGKMEADAISAAYKPVTKEMLKDAGQDFQFTRGDVTTDDGQAVPAYQISSAAKKPAN